MKKSTKILFFLAVIMLFMGCSAFFEPDLSKQKVDLLSPPDGLTTNTQTQTFIWDALKDADTYRLQVVSESFDYILDYIVDTTLEGTQYTITLEPGIYEWRVIGKNSATETDFDKYQLTILEDTTLANQTLNIIAPADNAHYVWDSITFLWEGLTYATQYKLQVANHPSFNSLTLLLNATTANDYYTSVGSLGTGTYYWRLRGYRNVSDSTDYSTTLSFSVDAIPVPLSPNNGGTVSLPVLLDWNAASSTLRDTIYIYYENEATAYLSFATTADSYYFSPADTVGKGAGIYRWKVKSLSTNNNSSSFCATKQFYVN